MLEQCEKVARQNTWDELTADERIATLRNVLRSKEMAIAEMREQIGVLMRHSHGHNGEPVVPLGGYGLGGSYPPGYRDDPLA